MPKLSDRVNTFTDSVIRRMTRISDEYGAINLSQGFPDFDPPKAILDRLAEVAYEGPHQYLVQRISVRPLLRNRERLSDARSIRRRRLWLPAAAQKL